MFNSINPILKSHNTLSHINQGITVCSVQTLHEGLQLAKDILSALVDRKAVLYLSGGSMKVLYQKFAEEEKIVPGAVGLVDERFGQPMHENSNERAIADTGFLRYLQMRDVPFYPVLQPQKTREEVADAYDQKLRELHATFQKSVAILGIGADGHTAGIAPERKDFHNPLFDPTRRSLLVSEFNDESGYFKERVTMTFTGLAMLDVLIVFVFGSAKQNALEEMFEDGREEDLPARFYKRPEIAKKTLFITDQRV